MKVKVGQRTSYERTFTAEDVKSFAELSGDRGIHHMRPDSSGKTMIQGLLTATIPTKLGGDINYIASEMTFQFVRPVFVGDTVRCEALVSKVTPGEGRLDVTMNFVCCNQHGKEVLIGRTRGIIRI